MKRIALLLACLTLFTVFGSSALQARLEDGFTQPPGQTKPWCYWYWISDNISKEGITRDLEAMSRVGIGEALIGNIFLDDVPAGKIKVLSDEWWELVQHAIREGGRTGVNIGMFNCPGWSQSGGPWIQPGQSMRYLTSQEIRVTGPVHFNQMLPSPTNTFQQVSVIAFPAPQKDNDSIFKSNYRITSFPKADGLEKATDANASTAFVFPNGAGQGKNAFTIEFETGQLFTARTLQLTPSDAAWSAHCELQAQEPDGSFKIVKSFQFDRSNMAINVGFIPRGPVSISFPAVSSKIFRLVFTAVSGNAALAEIDLSGGGRIESFVEKQLGKMHPTPQPMWDTYLWATQPEPDSAPFTVPQNKVVSLASFMKPDGTLIWDVPAGDWIILRTGMVPTGTRNSPASPEGQGLEVDKMNRQAAQAHFDAFIGQVLKRMPASERKAFKHVVADSYEMGSQNWTDGFETTFKKRYGYDPIPWLPALTGRIMESTDRSERFLWDLRRLVADHVAMDYVGGLRDAAHRHGLKLWLENYGHWGFPAEFLQYGGQSDCIGGEYWVTGDLGSIECRAASSCGNTYGKPTVSAESFTGGPAFQTTPWAMKARGDWAFCEGINHFVLHVYIQQPWEDRVPGVNAWFGTEFNRHNTWFEQGKPWMDYLRRCCYLLQQGCRVADVAYFIGEDAPKMTGARTPGLPAGHDFDYINSEVIIKNMTFKNGRLTLPHGANYRMMVLPKQETMRPELLRKVRDLIKSGATIMGEPPSHSPSMENFPKCDEEIRTLTSEIWGNLQSGERRSLGRGQIIREAKLEPIFAGMKLDPDFDSTAPLRYTHRQSGDTDLYFIANPKAEQVSTMISLRVTGKEPEFWWPDSGRMDRAAVYDEVDGLVKMPLHLGPAGSVFVVLRNKSDHKHIVSASLNNKAVLNTKWNPSTEQKTVASSVRPGNFTMAIWVKPGDVTTLVTETNAGVSGMSEKRNDVLFPPHGNSFGEGNNAGCGLSVGRNGVVVFEHGGNYFSPILVHPAALTDWTHVMIVYREGQPSLYLNGVLARKGLKSHYAVYPGASSHSSGSAQYRGRLGNFEVLHSPMEESEVAAFVKSMSRPDASSSNTALTVTRSADGGIQVEASQAGSYEFKTANGKSILLDQAPLPASVELSGSWQVLLKPGMGAPDQVTFPELVDWTQHPLEGIKHYSGKATYRKEFNLPFDPATSKTHVILDLGEVRDLATIRINGTSLTTLWNAPWSQDITAALRPGTNTLEIEVVNAWNNRLVGDASLPENKRHTFILAPTIKKDMPLMTAGLLGPVTLRMSAVSTLRFP